MDKQFDHVMKRAEIDAWDAEMGRRARAYVAQGMSYEAAEERACQDIRREIIASPRRT